MHNTYFTLPVLFIMISNHYPMTYGHSTAGSILAVIMLAGALIRQYFVLRHVGKNLVALPAVATVLLLGLAIAIAPRPAATGAPSQPRKAITFAQVAADHQGALHGLPRREADLRRLRAAAGRLDARHAEQIKAAAQRIHQQTIATPGDADRQSHPDDRRGAALLGKWLAEGAKTQ